MRKDYERLFPRLKPPEPPAGLFDRIILAIKREQQLRDTKQLAFGFLALLVASLSSIPFSWLLFASQLTKSGLFQFTSLALSDIGTFFALWPNFVIAIAESLPVMALVVFAVNMILAIFTLRLFLHKKGLLVGYLLNSFSFQ